MRFVWISAILAVLCGPAMAHDVSYDLRGSGAARVVFHYQDGTPMTDAHYEVFAPGSGALPAASGLTDGAGGVDFTATGDGDWRVDVHDGNGHASRARLKILDGLPSLAGQALPDWVFVVSLLVNLALISSMFFNRRLPPQKGR